MESGREKYYKENLSDAYGEAKRGIKKVILIWFVIFVASIIIEVIFFNLNAASGYNSVYDIFCVLGIYFLICSLVFFICALVGCRCKRYFFDDNEIVV